MIGQFLVYLCFSRAAQIDFFCCMARTAAMESLGMSAGEGRVLPWDCQLDSEIGRMTILQNCPPRDETGGLTVVVGLPKRYYL